MAVKRQFNWKGQQRVDVPHLRSIESAVAADFDTLAGKVLSGKQSYVVRGFKLTNATVGTPVTMLTMDVADGVLLHYNASEHGTMLEVAGNQAPEVLSVTNTRVIGGFTNSQDNYIGIDYVRTADATTSDLVQFLDPSTLTKTPKTIPLSRTLDYRIVISTTPFSANTSVCPVAIVTVSSSGTVSAVKDARNMYFRLAPGGDSPNPLGLYNWPDGRAPEVDSAFTGGDKAITHERDWKAAIMQRLWEISGGEYWYSDTTDRNVAFTRKPTVTLADNFTFDGTTIRWEGLGVVLTNSTAVTNTIQDNTTGVALAAGQCLYVDINRTTDGSTLVPAVTTIASLGTPTRVGSRFVIAWRPAGSAVAFGRGQPTEIGRAVSFQYATPSITGIVRAYTADQVGGFPIALVVNTSGVTTANGMTGNTGSNLSFTSNLVGNSASTDFLMNSATATRSAGLLFDLQNNGTSVFRIAYNGTTNLAGALITTGALTSGGNFTVNSGSVFSVNGTTGATFIAGDVTISSASIFRLTAATGALALGSGITVNTDRFTVNGTNGNTSVAGTLGVGGLATLSAGLSVTGTITSSGAITANGGVVLGASQRVQGVPDVPTANTDAINANYVATKTTLRPYKLIVSAGGAILHQSGPDAQAFTVTANTPYTNVCTVTHPLMTANSVLMVTVGQGAGAPNGTYMAIIEDLQDPTKRIVHIRSISDSNQALPWCALFVP